MIRSQIALRRSAHTPRPQRSGFARVTTMTFLWALLALALHVWPGFLTPAHAQGSRKDDIVFNSRGIPLAGATVRVCAMPATGQPCTPVAQIYSDAALTQALANPTTTDGLGNYFFYATPGKYEIEITGPGITTRQIPNVILPNDPSSSVQTNLVNTFTAQQNFDSDTRLKGPNPYADVRAFGKFATLSSTAANTISGSSAVTLASAQSFQNGEYVTIFNAGAACSLSTPAAPTITPSVNMGGFNTTAAGSGSTSYNYKIVAADKFGCYTPASPAATIANGNALGLQTATVTSWTRSGTTVTVTTSAAHPYVVNQMIHFRYFTSSEGSVEGFWMVASVPDSTHFTFSSGLNTTLGASTSGTGGTVYGFNANAITWTAVPNAFKYYIYGRSGGTYTLLGQSMLTKYVDYGSPMNDNQTFPPFIPTTAPSVGANDHLTAKINSGGGTTTLTLASSAGATLTGATALSDDGPALAAAFSSASCTGQSTSVPIFVSHAGLTINSFTAMPAGCGVPVKLLLNNSITTNDTIDVTRFAEIRGWGAGSAAPSSFSWSSSPQIVTSGKAYPMLYNSTGSDQIFDTVTLSDTASNGYLVYYNDGGGVAPSTNLLVERVNWLGGNNGQDYVGMLGIFNSSGFSYRFEYDLFSTNTPGPNDNTNIGNTPVPGIIFMANSGGTGTGNTSFSHSWFLQRASVDIDATANTGIPFQLFKDIQVQSSAIPVFQLTSAQAVSLGGANDVQDIAEADRATAFMAVYGPPGTFIGSTKASHITCNTGNRANITGLPTGGVWFDNVCNTGYSTSTQVGMASTDSTVRSTSTGATLPVPPAPASCAVSAGGNVGVGTFSYAYEGIDIFGNRTTLGPGCTFTTTPGNQTVTVVPPAANTFPAGTVSMFLYRAGVKANIQAITGSCNTPMALTATFVDTYSFTCGTSADTSNSAVSSQIGTSGVATTSLTEISNGFTITHSAPTTTTNRVYTNPDVTGYIPVTGYVNGAYDNATRANGAIGANWTVTNNGINISGNNFVGTAITNDVAYWNANPFSSSQYSQVTITTLNGTTDFPGVAVLLSGSGGSTQGYECVENTANIYLQKVNGTTNTTLTSAATTGTNGDVLRLEAAPGGALTCYKNGASTLTATDTTYTSGQPGLFLFGTVATSRNWSGGNLRPLAHLDLEQDWVKTQHFVQGMALGGESLSSSPRGEQNVFLPGALTSTWTGATWTTDKAVTVTRVQVQAKTAPGGCTTNASVRLTDGTAPVNVTVSAAANDSGPITQNYAAGAALTVGVQVAAAGCTTSPADANVVVQYRMQ